MYIYLPYYITIYEESMKKNEILSFKAMFSYISSQFNKAIVKILAPNYTGVNGLNCEEYKK
jgi:hypothetical protein